MNWTHEQERLLTQDLIRDEGWRAYAYRDTLGYLTIGYGFLVDTARPGEGLPPHIAKLWMEHILEKKHQELQAAWPYLVVLPPGVRRGVLNMAYQLGTRGLLGFRKMITALESRDYETARAEALNSKWARSDSPNRALRVANLIGAGK